MQELQERMNNADWRGIIGDIFAKMTSASANLLDIYTSYVNAFPKSISTLSKCTRSSQKFRKFLEVNFCFVVVFTLFDFNVVIAFLVVVSSSLCRRRAVVIAGVVLIVISSLFQDCYENPVVERLDLPSFLLSPVQRLPRYVLLLRVSISSQIL